MEPLTEQLNKKHEVFLKSLGFSIQGYDYSPEFGGSTYIIYVKTHLRIMVVKSRDGISYEFGGGSSAKDAWFSLDIIRHFLGNMDTYKKLKQINPIQYISDNIDPLENAFSDNKREKTISVLKDLEKKRAKKLFK